MSVRAFFKPCATATFSLMPWRSTSASFTPSSPRTGAEVDAAQHFGVTGSVDCSPAGAVSRNCAVRNAASITPPVAPKITAAPEAMPKAGSKASSGRLFELQTGQLDQACRFARGEHIIHILVAAVGHLRTLRLHISSRYTA